MGTKGKAFNLKKTTIKMGVDCCQKKTW